MRHFIEGQQEVMPDRQELPASAASPWEYGSEFHWVAVDELAQQPILPQPSALFGSGRDALRALVALGMRERGWQRWLVPAYFCQDVVGAIGAAGVEVAFYQDSPLRAAPLPPEAPLRRGDVLLLVNYFGLRGPEAAKAVDPGSAEIVEDHTHDPWSRWAVESRADYCIVSLRKTLPLPDGGVLWSPKGHALPGQPPLTPDREAASLTKLGAMILKRLYLDGHAIDKDTFRSLQMAGEDRIATGGISGPSRFVARFLPALPWQTWRRQRTDNYRQLRETLVDVPGVRVVDGVAENGSCPFSLVVQCDNFELRQRLRSRLIAQSIYPAVLWPIADGGVPILHEAAQLSRQLLSLPCDFRYRPSDLLRVAEAMRQALVEVCSW